MERKTENKPISQSERDEERSRYFLRSQIIEQVENDLGTTNLGSNILFATICERLTENGFELHEKDAERYNEIREKESIRNPI